MSHQKAEGIMIIKVNPIIAYYFCRNLCRKPYYNHKRGCPNYGKKDGCPPKAPPFDDVYNSSKPVYAIFSIFDFKGYINRMRRKHPDWSRRQLECCLYWQGTARKALKIEIEHFRKIFPSEYVITRCPEGMGVLVTNTMRQVGIELEWPPQNVTYQIAFAGILKEKP